MYRDKNEVPEIKGLRALFQGSKVQYLRDKMGSNLVSKCKEFYGKIPFVRNPIFAVLFLQKFFRNMRIPFSSQFNSAEALLYVSSQQWGLYTTKTVFMPQSHLVRQAEKVWKGGQESHFIEIPFSKYFSCFPFWSRNPILSKSHLLAKVLYVAIIEWSREVSKILR